VAVELYPHQKKAVKELDNGKILLGGVGVGKSITAAAYYMARESPRDVYVITTAKKRDSLDWKKEFALFGVGPTKDATVAGVLTIDSWNNIGRYVGVTEAFFIFDEQRVVGSGAWAKSFIKIARANRWILLSATPGDTWLDYVPVFVANGFYKNQTEFKREHVVYSSYTKFPKVERYISTGKLLRYRDQLLVDMPYPRHTVRHTHIVEAAYDEDLIETVLKRRWNVFEDQPLKDVAEMFRVGRRVVYSDPSRLETVKCLMKKHKRLIVFYNFDYELEQLRTLAWRPESNGTSTQTFPSTPGTTSSTDTYLTHAAFPDEETSRLNDLLIGESVRIPQRVSTESSWQGSSNPTLSSASAATPSSLPRSPQDGSMSTTTITDGGSDFQVAEWNGHKHQEVPETDRWIYLVQYVAGAEGWNCTSTDAMVMYSLTYSYKNWEQAYGRIDRLNTPFVDLHYYVLKSKSFVDNAVWKALSHKESFNESQWRRYL